MNQQPALPLPGPDAAGQYHYVGDRDKLPWAVQQAGNPICSQADLQALAPILRQDQTWAFEKPQTYYNFFTRCNKLLKINPDSLPGVPASAG